MCNKYTITHLLGDAMASISHIHRDTAKRVRLDLINSLGTENVPNQWMHFMATVRQHLPEVLSRGRPTRQAIDASVIGALGFPSWRELLEAPTDAGGLGLSWSTWRQWSRAWAVVQKYPDLERAPLTAAEINRLHSDAKAASVAMPTDMAAVEAFWEEQEKRREIARAETHTALKVRVEALEASLSASREEAAHTHGTVIELRRQIDQAQIDRKQAEQRLTAAQQRQRELEEKTTQLQEQLQRSQRDNQRLSEELRARRNRSFWQRVQEVFSPQ
jgi:hypothetical protein